MKISLESLDARALKLDLGGPGDELVSVSVAEGLAGTLERRGETLALSGVTAERVVLDALRLLFSSLSLTSASGAVLEGVLVTMEQAPARFALDVRGRSVAANDLRLAVSDVVIEGRPLLEGARLVVQGDEGRLSAERLRVGELGLRLGEVVASADVLDATSVEIAWGGSGFRFVAGSAMIPSLHVDVAGSAVAARGLAVTTLSVHDGSFSAASVTIEKSEVAAPLTGGSRSREGVGDAAPEPAREQAREAREPSGERVPLVDWRVLDGLSGQIDVDVTVDLTVPILGRRKATHMFRVPVSEGAIDYRGLESNLSALEDAILDFAVRDGGLALERVNPLLPARGFGKPIVIWDLDTADQALAERDRVRLAVLPRARLAESDGASKSGGSGGGVALQKLGLEGVAARLSLEAAEVGQRAQVRLLRATSIAVKGGVFYDAGEPAPAGAARVEIEGLAARISALRLGSRRLDVGSLAAASVAPLEITFADLTPTALRIVVAALELADVSLSG